MSKTSVLNLQTHKWNCLGVDAQFRWGEQEARDKSWQTFTLTLFEQAAVIKTLAGNLTPVWRSLRLAEEVEVGKRNEILVGSVAALDSAAKAEVSPLIRPNERPYSWYLYTCRHTHINTHTNVPADQRREESYEGFGFPGTEESWVWCRPLICCEFLWRNIKGTAMQLNSVQL